MNKDRTDFMVGSDHAGPGMGQMPLLYYGSHDVLQLVSRHQPEAASESLPDCSYLVRAGIVYGIFRSP